MTAYGNQGHGLYLYKNHVRKYHMDEAMFIIQKLREGGSTARSYAKKHTDDEMVDRFRWWYIAGIEYETTEVALPGNKTQYIYAPRVVTYLYGRYSPARRVAWGYSVTLQEIPESVIELPATVTTR